MVARDGLEPAAVAREREPIARDLPVGAELMAACALVGAPIDRALAWSPRLWAGRSGAGCGAVLTRLELGADPAGVWRGLEDATRSWRPLARTLVRAMESGAPPAEG